MRKRFQKGHLLHRSGKWFIRYKDTVLQKDGSFKRKLCFAKLDVADDARSTAIRAAASSFLQPFNDGSINVQSSMTLVNYIEQNYLPEHVDQLRPASRRQYRGVWTLYIKPWLSPSITLREFRTIDGEILLKTIGKKTKACRSSLFHVKAFLSGAFNQAMRLGILPGNAGDPNPMTPTKVPKKPASVPTHAYSMNEVQSMLAVLSEPARTVVICAACTGLRKSELWGLRWDDYDGKTLTIRRSIWNGIESDPKTEASKASVPVVDQLADALELHRESMGLLAVNSIFQCTKLTALNLDNLARREIKPRLNRCRTCKKLEAGHPTEGHLYERDDSLPTWRGWHAFRRGLATNLHEMGVADREIQAILRHDDISTTQKSYIKSTVKSTTDAMNQLGEKLTFTSVSQKPAQVPDLKNARKM